MQVEVGAIVEGKVTGLTNFGAFVSLPDGKTGMVHISEVAPTYVKEIRDYLKENQEVKVKVLSVGQDGRVSLSIKRAMEPQRPPQQRQRQGGGQRRSSPPVWQGSRPVQTENLSFEDMMARFKQISDEKITDLKRSSESKHGGGFSRRGNGSNR
ncbi:MAG TPA: S1 RNA-binding domain-containing protein [Candidatus Fimivicinus intestinavium]|nr:S1 RNA-binding domain-containing protein [Candidatus Fimivicinus intestinavium]